MTQIVDQLAASGDILVEAQLQRPPRRAQYAPIPDDFAREINARSIDALLPDGHDLYRHQAAVLEHIAVGKNVLLATGTASGKSLPFQLSALERVLNRDETVLVFYPQKALAADQAHRWRAQCVNAGFSPELVREINGDVPMTDREAAVRDGRILLVTPDVTNTWIMPQSRNPTVQAFLQRLSLLILDEAHAFEGAFGTNVAYLIRRLQHVRDRLGQTQPLQIVAASATTRNPGEHLEALTGLAFTTVGEADNGAPEAGCKIAHIAGPDHGSVAEAQVAALVEQIIPLIGDNAFIVFADSRQGVERIARRVNRLDVLPYRSGYEASDHRRIEQALRNGELRGVIATSSLELGIDFPQFVLGINVGLPTTRKSLLQRIGRVGRREPGAFLVMCPPQTFAQLGTDFADYVTGELEPSPLYLANQFRG